jgi:hypothetical protein
MSPEEQRRRSYLTKLREQIVERFSLDEIRLMCSDLGVDYEELREGPSGTKTEELIKYLEHRDQVPELVKYCSEKRPQINWEDTGLGDVLTETESELKGNLAAFQDGFQSALQQIDVLSDYKDLHDYLHDLQFGWFPLVQDKVKDLPDAKGAIQDLRGYEREFRTAIGKLNDTVDNKKVPENERSWVNKLEEARQHLRQGISSAEPDMTMIDAAVQSIGQVLDTQPTYINGDLMRAVGALRLPQLRDIVKLVLDKLTKKDPRSDIVKQLQQGIVDLNLMNIDLDTLMEEHDIWQANEGKIPMMLLALDNLAFFNILWQQLKDKTSRLYKNRQEEWATDLQGDEASVDQAIKANENDAAREAFKLFYKDAKQRFWDVDKLIKKKCKELSEIRAKMPTDK